MWYTPLYFYKVIKLTKNNELSSKSLGFRSRKRFKYGKYMLTDRKGDGEFLAANCWDVCNVNCKRSTEVQALWQFCEMSDMFNFCIGSMHSILTKQFNLIKIIFYFIHQDICVFTINTCSYYLYFLYLPWSVW